MVFLKSTALAVLSLTGIVALTACNAEEPGKNLARVPAGEPRKDSARERGEEPARDSAKEHGRVPTGESAKELGRGLAEEPAREPARASPQRGCHPRPIPNSQLPKTKLGGRILKCA